VAEHQQRRPNRLIHEKSPYLLQHAYNPVDWYPWGEEAFRKAREEDRPIFLSIGYSTCHWCHVMERESFENPEIASSMNELFVNIKVDREERPDVDLVYMTFVQASTGSGGWPLSVWLTPDLKPFYGGTYFPPRDRWGRPGFATVLRQVGEIWAGRREEVKRSGEDITRQMRTATAPDAAELPDSAAPYHAFRDFEQSFDQEHGGFGGAPKFPRASVFKFLIRYFAQTGDEEAARMVFATLLGMAHGGIYDHLGGGFHRYSVDAYWHVPHFEKMLYDQAQLATSFLDACQASGKSFFARIAHETLEYVLRDLADAETGGFYSAEDADSPAGPGGEHTEGAFYLWTAAEIDEALGPDAELFRFYYAIQAEGNAQDPQGEPAGKNVLHVIHTIDQAAEKFGRTPAEIAAVLGRSRAKLLEMRSRRARPQRDDKIVCAWNGLMISALARASQVLGDKRYLEVALRAARFARAALWSESQATLWRRYCQGEAALEGYAEDYAFLAQGLLDLYEACFNLEWLKLADRLNARMIELFWDEASGGFFSTSGRDPSVLLRMKEDYDGAQPSPNSVAALNLLRLAEMLDRDQYRQKAGRLLEAFAGRLNQEPAAVPQMVVALMSLKHAPAQVIVAGERHEPGTESLLRTIHEAFLPNKVVLLADRSTHDELDAHLPYLRGMRPQEGHPAVYVCHHYACERPIVEPQALHEALARCASRSAG
jgi:hypothetical protein